MGPRKGSLKKFLTEPVFCDLSVFLDLSIKNCCLEWAKNHGTDFSNSLEYKKIIPGTNDMVRGVKSEISEKIHTSSTFLKPKMHLLLGKKSNSGQKLPPRMG